MPCRFCRPDEERWWALGAEPGDGRRAVVARRSQDLRPSWVIFHPFPRGSCNRPHKWFVQLLPPSPNAPTPTLAWFGCPSRAAPGAWGRPRTGDPAKAGGLTSPPTHTPGDGHRSFPPDSASARAGSPPARSPCQSLRLCRNSGAATIEEKRWCHHQDHK